MSGRGAFYKAKYGGGRHRQNSSSESRQFFKHHDHFGETVHSQNGFASAPQDDQFEMNSDLDDHISYQSDLSREHTYIAAPQPTSTTPYCDL